ncbi:sulfotransferase family protein [Alteromonas aestuariivivens]|uniref:Sulfotransferase family protein n=1 Tax=Alteromonas aestuariivivens TaxID=1938339 RepID=A0A3D8MCD9_9ALTE|nr:sulfotransferase [Alteromonas aestuariivivens]RDV28166.1 sulfotransferase family protein [Alteromonas aestuariivivens]
MPKKVPLLKRIRQICSNKLCLLNQRYRNVYWLLGDGRSGTTWIASLLNSDQRLREMFEPFHPWEVREAAQFSANMYVRPCASYPELRHFCQQTFEGKISSSWIDKDNHRLLYDGLLVKDIFANLMASWACRQFDFVKPVLLVRNPLAVAASKNKTRHWHWQSSTLEFFADEKLVEDYLRPFEALAEHVHKKHDYFLTQVFNWCVIHFVLFQQLDFERVPVIFYEDVYLNPHQQISRLREQLGMPDSQVDNELITRASRVSFGASAILNNQHPLVYWRSQVSEMQMVMSKTILYEFGLQQVYPDLILPGETPWASFDTRREVCG